MFLSYGSPGIAQPTGNDNFFQLGPDSLLQEGVPHGEVSGPHVMPSQVFEGTQHTYWVDVPAQYDAEKPSSLMIFNDGHAFLNDQERSVLIPINVAMVLFKAGKRRIDTTDRKPGFKQQRQACLAAT